LKNALNGQILVDFRPMNTETGTGNLPMATLGFGGMQKARVPCQGHAHRSTVCKIHHKRIRSDTH